MATLRLLHTADWHLGKKLERFSRLAEQEWVLERLVEIAEREAVQAVLIAGDIYDSPNPSPEAEALFAQITVRLAKGGERPVICLAGNHDSAERLDALRPWGAPLGILMVGSLTPDSYPTRLGRAELEWFFPSSAASPNCSPNQNGTQLEGYSAPLVGAVEIRHPSWPFPLRLILSPYVSPYRLPPVEAPFESWLRACWIEALNAFPKSAAPVILITHTYVGGDEAPDIQEDPEEKSLKIGGLPGLSLSVFPEGIEYVALGHIHRAKIFGHRMHVAYPGSILQYSFDDTFDDTQQGKGVIRVNIEKVEGGPKPYKVSLFAVSLFRAAEARPVLVQQRATTYEEAQSLVQTYKDHYLKLIWEGMQALSPEEIHELKERHEKLFLDFRPLVRMTGVAEQPATERPTLTSLEEVFWAYYKELNGREPYDRLMELFREVLERARRLS
ncbi:MAG: exonuclease subunit SbcD [Bacteroidia bacterium]